MSRCRDCNSRTRAMSGLCWECTQFPVNRSLPEGEWVGGLVKRFVPTKPVLPPWIPAHTLGVTCDCGCLLIDADERCPACLVWAELDAARTTWNLPMKEAA